MLQLKNTQKCNKHQIFITPIYDFFIYFSTTMFVSNCIKSRELIIGSLELNLIANCPILPHEWQLGDQTFWPTPPRRLGRKTRQYLWAILDYI